ncbi:glycosyltransferase [Candidatus Halobonum tyrrellensis]|uniref:Glycosyltransferase 2-like domain-containing protein n=1 Tax=Candidatus Halobonum tyrrellensis G22 TaxID=1324957 RepID=V4IW66_9EURY|nr:glycosyltransferase family 2 protein [Candidatus Halobonum tyrrellensis]ESP87417.1 hypothetical protein K933_14118 [Candidatus Halobonum tyrrellensis G22]
MNLFGFQFDVAVFVSLVLWQLVVVYTLPVGYWLYEVALTLVKRPTTPSPPVAWGLEDVQVRILTVDAADVVQRTVDALPEGFDSVLVIAESPTEIAGDCEVLVVPEEFECEARAKGRAIEWARRAHPTDCEYVLYLDEDSVVGELDGIPDADVVQFRERPTRTGGLLPFLAEVHRIGFGVEQSAFPFLRVPLYAWGGGVAVRTSVEDRVGWDVHTVVEDSVFVWRALLNHGATYCLSDTAFENQAPPSVRAMVGQRRRWLTGTRMSADLLPFDYQLLYTVRDVGWVVSVFAPALWALSTLSLLGVLPVGVRQVLLPEVYIPLSFVLLGFVYLWSLVGLYAYRESVGVGAACLLVALTPLVVIVHSVGALYGFVDPATGFDVTEKVVHTAGPERSERPGAE